MDYRNSASNPPKLYSFGKVRTALRRQGKLELYDDVDKGALEVVYLAGHRNPGHIICYHKTVETKEDLAAKKTVEVGHPVVYGTGAEGSVGSKEIGLRIKNQELMVAWYYYVKFRTPAFFHTSAEIPVYDPDVTMWQPPVLMGSPPEFLAKLKARRPDLLVDQPGAIEFSRFKKYLEENAPPRLLNLIEENKLCVGMKADLRVPTEWVACWVAPESKPKDDRQKFNLVVDAAGNIRDDIAPELVNPWIEKNQAKRN